MFKAELITGSEFFDCIQADEWNILAMGGMTNTPFQHFAYQKAWWEHLGEGQLIGVIVRGEDKSLRGIAPLNLRDGRLVFNASKEETDYLDLIARADDAEAVWTAVIDCLCSEANLVWDVLDMFNIPAASPSRDILPRLAKSRGFVFSEERAEVCPVISLNRDFENYLAELDKKQRHEIRRKLRRANGADAVVHIVDKDDDLPAQVNRFLELLQMSTPEKEAWLNNGRRALFHDVARAALDQGILLLMFMEVEGEPLAALFNFCYGDRIWVYNSGLNMTRRSNLSLGVVITAEAIKYAAENQYNAFDFLRGDEEYKYRFGAQDTEIFRVQLHTDK